MPATEYVDSFGNLCQRYTLPRGESVVCVETEVEVAEQLVRASEQHSAPRDLVRRAQLGPQAGGDAQLSDRTGRVAPGADTAVVVTRIRELNGLQGSAVVAGRPLVVPSAG